VAKPAVGELRRLSDERTRTLRATVLHAAVVRSRPNAGARRVGALGTRTYFGIADLVVLLGRSASDGGAWSLVRYPGIGRRTGWVPTAALADPEVVSSWLVIDRGRQRVRLFRRGHLAFEAKVGVGARGSPTPGGRFYVRERIVPQRGSIYGSMAFGLSAYSRHRTDWPGGGQVGVHGTDEPELIPGRISNGCVRLRNRAIRRLDRLMPIGTPVLIR
jgi:L,D-transpeptidase catalytic domain